MNRFISAMKLMLLGGAAGRYRIKQEVAYRLANLLDDFPFSDGPQLWRSDAEFLNDYKRLSPRSQFSSDRKFMLAELMRAVEHLPGDVVECGSYQGASAYFLAKNSKAKIHLIDSFEGLSDPSALDIAKNVGARQWVKGDMSSQLSVIKNNLSEFSHIEFHKGWIPHVFEEANIAQCKLIHVDVDLYQPSKDSLEYFFPKLCKGGVLVLDDYGFLSCPGAKLAADEYFRDSGYHIILLTTGQGVVFKF